MFCLAHKSIENAEPILLIGETGCGKTTICEFIAETRGQNFYTINCHKFIESSDFLGSLRPVRGKDII